jgi:hypothetical protein
MSVDGETLSAINGIEEACATARARVEDLVAEVDDLRRCLCSVIAQRDEARAEVERLRGALHIDELDGRATYTVGKTEWAMRIANAEQRFADEYDAHQKTRTLLTDLYRQQLRADAAQMREYGISYHGLRKLFAEYDGGELSIGKVLELLRAAARELAKQEHDDERL